MNTLNIKIEVDGHLVRDVSNDPAPIYDPELDNITSIFSDICEALSLQSGIKFLVSGFGQTTWPVDVRTDLLCAVEELGEIVEKISKDNFNFEFYLYEQGIERKLEFFPKGNEVEVICTSYTDWNPDVPSILMKKEEIKTIFYKLKFNFCSAAELVCPMLTNHPWFKDWSGIRGDKLN